MTSRASPRRPTIVPASGVLAAPDRDEVHVVVGRRGAWSPAPRPPARRPGSGGVHVGHRHVADPAEDALQHRQREDAGVGLGQLALVDDLERGRARPRCSATNRRAQPLGQPRNGRAASDTAPGGDVHGEGHEVVGQRQARPARRWCRPPCPGPPGWTRPRWGVTITPGRPNSGRRRGRLLHEDVERGAAHVAGADGVGQGLLVDDAAPGHVDDAHARLGLGQAGGVEQARPSPWSWPRAG